MSQAVISSSVCPLTHLPLIHLPIIPSSPLFVIIVHSIILPLLSNMATRGKMSFRFMRNLDKEVLRREAGKTRVKALIHRTATTWRSQGFYGYVFAVAALFVLFYRLHSIIERCKANRQLVEKYFLRRHWNTAFLQVYYNSSKRARASLRRRRKTVEFRF
ncbi:hypothetical protein L596_006957 [Steinernema carpocapsae]|uniref:Uncharacterized protein n=1 Tax=Steinernema carpocapsae TaxID=34508 RepID=A0A4U5P879_STECR|nr:hypothetical protein L596_006957 [Steinernema carpocapsae]